MTPKRDRPLSGLELLGSQKARRAISARLAEAIAYALGAVGCTLTLTTQDGEANEKTGVVTFSTHSYIAWTQHLHALPQLDQEAIVLEHLKAAVHGDQQQLESFTAEFEANARRRSDAAKAEPCEGCPPKEEVPS